LGTINPESKAKSGFISWHCHAPAKKMNLSNTKSISMYHSEKESDYAEMFHRYIQCDVVYSKPFEGGTLYCLEHTKPYKSHRTLDNALGRMESEIDPDDTYTIFHSISEVMSTKVLTFAPMMHKTNRYYRAIFANHSRHQGGEREVFEDVTVWRPADNMNARLNNMKELEKRLAKAEAKAAAWDKHEDYLSTKQLEDAVNPLQNPMQKLSKMAALAGIHVRSSDTYKQLRKKVLFVTHSDKRVCNVDQEMLFEKICKAVNDLPARMN